jgi:hypothetical protein
MFRNKYRCVVVTDDAIYVLDSTKWSGGAKPQEMVGRMPRHARLGPVSGRWAEVDLLGERHWVHRRFHDQLAAADHEGGFSALRRPERTLQAALGAATLARSCRSPRSC